jgi:hypothetical protein
MAQSDASSSTKMCFCGTAIFFQFVEQSMVVITPRFLLMQIIRGKSDGRMFRRLTASSLVSVDSTIWGFANNLCLRL